MSAPPGRAPAAAASDRSGVSRVRELGLLLVALLVLLAVVLRVRGCASPAVGESAAYESLRTRLYRLERLELPAGLSALPPLPAGLSELSVESLSDRQLADLPPGLRRLEIRRGSLGAGLSDLSGLPGSLQSLTLEDGSLQRLGELPASLRSLRLGRVGQLDPDRIPAATTGLALDSVGMATLWRGLSGLESLELSGDLVQEIEGIGRWHRLTELSLHRTRVDDLGGLPRMLRSLDLEATRLARGWSLADLPPFLVELRLWDLPPGPDPGPGRFPESLRVLHVRADRLPSSLIAALPSGLVELRLEGELLADDRPLRLCAAGVRPGRPALDALEVLYLAGGVEVDLSCLPESLEVLYLEAAEPQELALIAAPLRGLGIVDSFGFDLADLTAPLAELSQLDLSFSRPRAEPDLAALGALRRLRYLVSPFETLPELPASLEVLDLGDSPELRSIEGLAGWCPELRVLRLGGTQVSSLDHVPASVEELDIRGLDLDDVDRLPPRLRKLTLSADAFARLGRLPPLLDDLSIVAVSAGSP